MTTRAVLLVGHGTISDPADVPAVLLGIRHGRPAPAEFVAEIQRRYRVIGGSPLLATTERLAARLGAALDLPVYVAMRFWSPLVPDVVARISDAGVDELAIVPVAPFSVHVYASVVRDALAELSARGARVPRARSARSYGSDPALVRAHADAIRPLLEGSLPSDTALVLSAHSLPLRVLRSGDPYQREFEASARAVARALDWPAVVAYQSQGEGAGEWLGPALPAVFEHVKREGARRVVVAPIGFLADHVETLYDLDVEAIQQARDLGLEFARVPALNDGAELVDALATVARDAFAAGDGE